MPVTTGVFGAVVVLTAAVGPKSPPVIAVATGTTAAGMAAATTDATRARSGVTSPRPSGCTRFDRKITNVLVTGSIHIDGPVKPVWPKDPIGNSSPRLDDSGESISQPRPRAGAIVSGVARRVIFATLSGERIRRPFHFPPARSIRANIARSSAVPNSPACPAYPPLRRAVGSCTTPRSREAAGVSQGQASGSHDSVGAMRFLIDEGGRKPVSRIPSG